VEKNGRDDLVNLISFCNLTWMKREASNLSSAKVEIICQEIVTGLQRRAEKIEKN